MSMRTSAMAEDFPHFNAWYGLEPEFTYLKNFESFHCRDEWFKIRQLTDMRYYANFQYAESESYNLKLILSRIEDLHRCRKIKKLPQHERAEAFRNWFTEKHQVNDVWTYKPLPTNSHLSKNPKP